MKLKELHPWDVPPQEARSIQQQLAQQVVRENHVPVGARLIAGVDISGVNRQGLATGAVVVLDVPTFTIREVRTVEAVPPMKYVPASYPSGKSPCWCRPSKPSTPSPTWSWWTDRASPTHAGSASPAISASSWTFPPSAAASPSSPASTTPSTNIAARRLPLMDRQDHLGAVLRTRTRVSPVYVSVGHKIDLDTAVRWVLSCCRKYRLPEPTRLAHHAAAGRLPPPSPNGASA